MNGMNSGSIHHSHIWITKAKNSRTIKEKVPNKLLKYGNQKRIIKIKLRNSLSTINSPFL